MLCVIHTSKTANVSIELVSVLLAFKCELTWTSQNKDIFEIIPDHELRTFRMRNEGLCTESTRAILRYFASLPFDQGVQAHQSGL